MVQNEYLAHLFNKSGLCACVCVSECVRACVVVGDDRGILLLLLSLWGLTNRKLYKQAA